MEPRKDPAPQTAVPASDAALLQRKIRARRKPYHLLDRAERLTLDRDRVFRLRLAVDATGDRSIFDNDIRPDVWDYANRTLPKLIASGKIFNIRSRAGGPTFAELVMPDDGIDYALAEDLAADTIKSALPRFERSVLEQWDGYRDDTATLGTYCVGLCSLVFAGPFRKMQRHQKRFHYGDGIDPDSPLVSTSIWDQPEAVIYDVEFERHVEIIDDPNEQLIVRLDSAGATERDIAEILELSVKAVEYRKKKSRAKLRAFWQAEAARDDFRGNAAASA